MRMSDAIECADFGRRGATDRSRWNNLRLPTSLQGADSTIVNNLIADADREKRPHRFQVNFNTCPPLHRS